MKCLEIQHGKGMEMWSASAAILFFESICVPCYPRCGSLPQPSQPRQTLLVSKMIRLYRTPVFGYSGFGYSGFRLQNAASTGIISGRGVPPSTAAWRYRLTPDDQTHERLRAATAGLLGLGCLGGIIGTGILGPYRAAFASHYNLTQTEIGRAIALSGIVFGGLGIWQGPRLADRMGRFSFLKVAVVLLTAGLAGCAAFVNIHLLAASWCVLILGAYLSVISNAVAADIWHDRPQRGVVLLHSFVSVGKILGPAVAAFLLMEIRSTHWHTWPWRGFFLFCAIFAGIVLVLLLIAPQRSIVQPAASADPAAKTAPGRVAVVWLPAALLGLIAGSEDSLATVAPMFFQNVRHVLPENAARLLTLHFIALIGGRFLFGLLGTKVKPKVTVAVGIVPVILVIPAVLARNETVFSISFMLLGLSFSAMWPSSFARLATVLAHDRSKLTYAVGMTNTLGIAACVWISSRILDAHPTGAMIFGPALLVLCAVVFVAFGGGSPKPDLARHRAKGNQA